ncbi:bifunctional biotin--[acetyl-CoA-carboxylase] ligase/biotin operon repressor BirA [Candidatus Regiella insecticola]|uniref:Bifunctional ligase/repressor BirA n=1 Tax=Candidatus Regiella insecticola TaxID=138073 RepID=A0A6L2ZP14_9ENTR|nr:bifunctional biotin--[acetyl-CoA-carboxylase] ligase/biotin operon repressor BirA [Candidatus Regiella insecticola]GFN46617.1 bifunctional ligase/repressor BirA [Candidatus Regiella insecticola]
MKKSKVPLRLINILADGIFHSGEQLGEIMGISRTAINKHIRTIKSWGLDVFSLSGRGYCLTCPLQLLDEKKIRSYMPSDSGNIEVLSVIDSTNQYLLDRMNELQSGDACVAEYQYSGRGRRGRQWVSPFGSNIYLSMFWRLEQGPESVMGLSLVIGTAIAEVLKQMGVEDIRVKWPNDLYLHGKKLAGILVELTGKMGDAVQLVMGVGINILMPITAQKESINQDWTTLQEAGITIDRNKLTAELFAALKRDMMQFEKEGLTAFIDRWRQLDNYCDCPVKLIVGKKEIKGIARGIDSQGALLLEQNGTVKAYSGGEISLRGV